MAERYPANASVLLLHCLLVWFGCDGITAVNDKWQDGVQVNGGQLPSHVLPFCIASAALAAMLPLASFFIHTAAKDADAPSGSPSETRLQWLSSALGQKLLRALPSGIGFAVGMYVAPKWTIPRVIGSVVEQGWLWWRPGSHASLMVVVASGLVLGEGTTSIVTAVSKAVGASMG